MLKTVLMCKVPSIVFSLARFSLLLPTTCRLNLMLPCQILSLSLQMTLLLPLLMIAFFKSSVFWNSHQSICLLNILLPWSHPLASALLHFVIPHHNFWTLYIPVHHLLSWMLYIQTLSLDHSTDLILQNMMIMVPGLLPCGWPRLMELCLVNEMHAQWLVLLCQLIQNHHLSLIHYLNSIRNWKGVPLSYMICGDTPPQNNLLEAKFTRYY